jgi:hypothetical protein
MGWTSIHFCGRRQGYYLCTGIFHTFINCSWKYDNRLATLGYLPLVFENTSNYICSRTLIITKHKKRGIWRGCYVNFSHHKSTISGPNSELKYCTQINSFYSENVSVPLLLVGMLAKKLFVISSRVIRFLNILTDFGQMNNKMASRYCARVLNLSVHYKHLPVL